MKPRPAHWPYVIGFILSAALTLVAYALVSAHVGSAHTALSHPVLIAWIIALALVQLMVQLVLFLHLGQEAKPRWKLLAFGFMVLVLIILVFGSLWIMNNLNYHMMPPAEMNEYMQHEEGIHLDDKN